MVSRWLEAEIVFRTPDGIKDVVRDLQNALTHRECGESYKGLEERRGMETTRLR